MYDSQHPSTSYVDSQEALPHQYQPQQDACIGEEIGPLSASAPASLNGGGAGGNDGGGGAGGLIDESTATSVLLAHVVQLRGLWKFENASSKALRSLLQDKEAELESCLADLGHLEAYQDWVDRILLSGAVPWEAPTLARVASELILEAIDADTVHVYLLSPDGTSLTGWIDGDSVVESVDHSFIGFAALTEEPLFLQRGDQRLGLCHWPHADAANAALSSALLCRVTDRQGEVMGVIEVLNGRRRGGLPSDGSEGMEEEEEGFTDDDLSQLEAIEDQIVAVLRLIRILMDRSVVEANLKERGHKALLRHMLVILSGMLSRPSICCLYQVDLSSSSAGASGIILSGISSKADLELNMRPLPQAVMEKMGLQAGGSVVVHVPATASSPPQLWISIKDQDGKVTRLLKVQGHHEEIIGMSSLSSQSSTSFSTKDKIYIECFARSLEIIMQTRATLDVEHVNLSPAKNAPIIPIPEQMINANNAPIIPIPEQMINDGTPRQNGTTREIRRQASTWSQDRQPSLEISVESERRSHNNQIPTSSSFHRQPSRGMVRAGSINSCGATPRGANGSITSSLPSAPRYEALTQKLLGIIGSRGEASRALGQVESLLRKELDCQQVVLWTLDPSGKQELRASSGVISACIRLHAVPATSSFMSIRHIIEHVAWSGESIVLDDPLGKNSNFHTDFDDETGVGIDRNQAILAVPVRDRTTQGEMLGVIYAIGGSDSNSFSGLREWSLVNEVATALGLSLGRLLQTLDLERQVHELASVRSAPQSETSSAGTEGVRPSTSTAVPPLDMSQIRREQSSMIEALEEEKAMNQQLREEVQRLEDLYADDKKARQLEAEEISILEDALETTKTSLEASTSEVEGLRARLRDVEERSRRLEAELGERAQEVVVTRTEKREVVNHEHVLEGVLGLVKEIESETRLKPMSERLIKRVQEMLRAEACTLWLVDHEQKQLRNAVGAGGGKGDGGGGEASMSVGLAGYVARTGEIVYVQKAHKDPRFHTWTDEREGIFSETILSLPLQDRKGEVFAVLHIINCSDGVFDGKAPMEFVETSIAPVGLALARCVAYEKAHLSWKEAVQKATTELNNYRNDLADRTKDVKGLENEVVKARDVARLMEKKAEHAFGTASILAAIGRGANLPEVMSGLEDEVRRAYKVETVTCLFLMFNTSDTAADGGPTLWYPGNGRIIESRFSLASDLAGYTARTGEVVVVEDAYKDLRFNRELDERSNNKATRNVLCIPLRDNKGELVGVLQLTNKVGPQQENADTFTEDDVESARRLIGLLGPVLRRAMVEVGEAKSRQNREAETAFNVAKLRKSLNEQNGKLADAQNNIRDATQEQARLNEIIERYEGLLQWADSLTRDSYASNVETILTKIDAHARKVLGCELVVLLLLDREKDELWTVHVSSTEGSATVAQSSHTATIRLPLASSASSMLVMKNAQLVRMKDVSRDMTLQDDLRRMSALGIGPGLITRDLMCAPLRDANGRVTGVLQAYNKVPAAQGVTFSEADEELMSHMSGQLGLVIDRSLLQGQRFAEMESSADHNAAETKDLEARLVAQHEAYVLLQEQVHRLQNESNAAEARSRVSEAELKLIQWQEGRGQDVRVGVAHACGVIEEIFKASRAIIFFGPDAETGALWAPAENVKLLPPYSGLLGHAVRTGETVRVDHVGSDDSRFLNNREVDERLNMVTHSVLCCPLPGPVTTSGTSSAPPIGILQVCNRADSRMGPFTADEERLVQELAQHVAWSLMPDLQLDKQRNIVEEAANVTTRKAVGIVPPPRDLPFLDLSSLCREAANFLQEALGVGVAAVMLVDEKTGKAYIPSTAGNEREGDERGQTIELDGRIWERVVSHQEPLFVPDCKSTSLKQYQYQDQGGSLVKGVGSSPGRGRRPSRLSGRALTEARESMYYPLLISLLGEDGRYHQRTIGLVQTSHKNDGEAMNEGGLSLLSALASQISLAVQANRIVTSKLNEWVEEKANEVRTELCTAWHALTQLAESIQTEAMLPSFKESLKALSHGKVARRRRSRLSTLTVLHKIGDARNFKTFFRRLVSALVGCDDIAVLLETPSHTSRDYQQTVKGIPMHVIRRVAKSRQAVKWTASGGVEDEDADDAFTAATAEGPVPSDDADEEGQELFFLSSSDEESVDGLEALCLPISMSVAERGSAGVLVLLWWKGTEKEVIEPLLDDQIASLGALVSAMVGLGVNVHSSSQSLRLQQESTAARPSSTSSPQETTESLANTSSAALVLQANDPVPLETVEPLLQAQSLGQLFEAIRVVIGDWTHQRATARLYLLDRTRDLLWTVQTSERYEKGQEQHGSPEGVLAIPLTNGILGHVARSGSQELVWATAQHMFYEAKADMPECGLVNKASKGNHQADTICAYCARREQHSTGPMSPEERTAWEEYHLNLPRLYIPLRPLGGGPALGVVRIEFHMGHHRQEEGGNSPQRGSTQRTQRTCQDQQQQVEQVVNRVLARASILQSSVGRCVHLREMKTIADKSRQNTVEKHRLEEILRLAQEVVSLGKLNLVIDLCCGELVKVLCADKATLFLIDVERKLFYQAGDSGGKGQSLGEGVVGFVATSAKVLRLPDGSKRSKKGGANDRVPAGLDLSSGHGVRMNLDGRGYRTESLLCVPIKGPHNRGSPVVGVLMLQNRKEMSHFTDADESLATRFCGYLGAALKNCRTNEECYRSGLVERILQGILAIPEASLVDLASLCEILEEMLARVLRVDGARLLLSFSRQREIDGSEVIILQPASKVGEKRPSEHQGGGGGAESRRGFGVEVGSGSLTETALRGNKAVVCEDVRKDARYNRMSDSRSDGYLGAVALPKRAILPGGCVQEDNSLGVLQVWVSAKNQSSSDDLKRHHHHYLGLVDLSRRDAEKVLEWVGGLVVLILEWCLQGERWVQRARNLLQGAGLLCGSSIIEAGPIFHWVHKMVPRLCGSCLNPQLFLSDSATGELQYQDLDGTVAHLRPGDGSVAGRAIKTGQIVIMEPSVRYHQQQRGSNGEDVSLQQKRGEMDGSLVARVIAALMERGRVLRHEVPEGLSGGGSNGGPYSPARGPSSRMLTLCYPIKAPGGGGRVLGALQLGLDEDAAMLSSSSRSQSNVRGGGGGGGGDLTYVNVEAISHVCDLVGIAIDRLTLRVRAASKLKEREAEEERRFETLQHELSDVFSRQETLRTENELLRQKAEALGLAQEELEAAQSKLKKLKKEREVLITKYKETKAGRLQAVEDLNRQIRVGQMASSSYSEVQEEVRMMKAERESLYRDLEATRESGATLKRELEGSRKAVQHAKEIQSATASELIDLKEKIQGVQEECHRLEEELSLARHNGRSTTTISSSKRERR